MKIRRYMIIVQILYISVQIHKDDKNKRKSYTYTFKGPLGHSGRFRESFFFSVIGGAIAPRAVFVAAALKPAARKARGGIHNHRSHINTCATWGRTLARSVGLRLIMRIGTQSDGENCILSQNETIMGILYSCGAFQQLRGIVEATTKSLRGKKKTHPHQHCIYCYSCKIDAQKFRGEQRVYRIY